MKKRITIFLSLFIAFISLAYAQEKPARLIIRVDDMGFSHSGNVAILKTLQEGIATSVEVIIPSPWFPEAVKMLREAPDLDVGIHLTLTSEWSNIKYRPVSCNTAITDEDGYFYPFIWPHKEYPGNTLTEHEWTVEDIEKEFRAQIELALKKLPKITHVSAHMGCYEMTPEVKAMTQRLVQAYKIDIDPEDFNVKRARLEGPKATSEEKIQSFIKMLQKLKSGETYLFVEHPGLDTPELRSIHHAGYNNVAIDRQGVTDMLTDPEVKNVIKYMGIELISYADLLK